MRSPPAALGRYLILEELGAGSFARVFRCEHMFTHEKFAGKLYKVDFAISEQGCKMLRNEISILKLLRHPGVIRFKEVVSDKNWMLVVTELVEGRTLLNVMPPSGGLPESFARPIFKQILDAMAFLHCNGIVHRDIKLENVMIQNDGSVKIIDFGLADHVPEEAAKEGLLIDGQCGSPHYYSPEVILTKNGDKFHGDKVDIWAAGVLLYSLVTGCHPFFAEHNDKDALFTQILCDEVSFENNISRGLKDLLQKVFVKKPSKRATIQELCNHPWTNNTFLAYETNRWSLGEQVQNEDSGLAPASLPAQNDDTQISTNAIVSLSSDHDGTHLGISPTPPTVNTSNLSIESSRNRSSGTDNRKNQNGKKEPQSIKRGKATGISSTELEFKIWRRVKNHLERMVRNSKKRGSCDEGTISETKKSKYCMESDGSSTSATGSEDDSRVFVSGVSLKERKLNQQKEEKRRSRRNCKIRFACWINV